MELFELYLLITAVVFTFSVAQMNLGSWAWLKALVLGYAWLFFHGAVGGAAIALGMLPFTAGWAVFVFVTTGLITAAVGNRVAKRNGLPSWWTAVSFFSLVPLLMVLTWYRLKFVRMALGGFRPMWLRSKTVVE